MFAFLKLLEKGFLLSCLLLSKDSPWQICLDLWMLHLLSYSYTLDFSAPDAYTCWWLGHGGFIYGHHPISESMTSFWPSCLHACWVISVLSNSLWPYGLQSTSLLCPWDFPGKNPGVHCHALLQGIFQTQGLNPCLLCLPIGRWILSISATWEALDHHVCGWLRLTWPESLMADSRLRSWLLLLFCFFQACQLQLYVCISTVESLVCQSLWFYMGG